MKIPAVSPLSARRGGLVLCLCTLVTGGILLLFLLRKSGMEIPSGSQETAAAPPAVGRMENFRTAPIPAETGGSSGTMLRAAEAEARLFVVPVTPESAATEGIPATGEGTGHSTGFTHFAANPGQDLTLRTLADGAAVLRSGLVGREWAGTLRAQSPDQSAGPWRAEGPRLSRSAGTLTEWYHNRPEGLEHGFTLAAAVPGNAIRMRLEGLAAEKDPASPGDLRFVNPADGEPVAAYRKLTVLDADGRVLPSSMTPARDGLMLAWNDAGARYPVTVDPVITSLEKKEPGMQAGGSAGASVAVSGDVAAVGAPVEDSPVANDAGQVRIYRRTGGVWTLEATLHDATGAAGDRFGGAVALTDTVLAAGAPDDDAGAVADAGSVSVFRYNAGPRTWTPGFRRAGTVAGQLGRSLAMEGNFLAAGVPVALSEGKTSAGQIQLINVTDGTLVRTLTAGSQAVAGAQFGHSVAVQGGNVLTGEPYTGKGRVWFFATAFTGTGTAAEVAPPAEMVAGDQFGHAVALSGNVAAVSAVAKNSHQGKVYTFTRTVSGTSGTWSQASSATAPSATNWWHYGQAVALNPEFLAVGALWADPVIGSTQRFDAGAVYLYKQNGGVIGTLNTVTAADGLGGDTLGTSVALSGRTLVAGATGVDAGTAADAGAAYFFDCEGTDTAPYGISSTMAVSLVKSESRVALANVPDKAGFRFNVTGSLSRLDALDVPLPATPPADGVYFPAAFTVNYQLVLTNTTTGTAVPLVNNGLIPQSVTMGAFTLGAAGQRTAVTRSMTRTLLVVPQDPSLILPGRNYALTGTVRMTDGGGASLTLATINVTDQKLLWLNGVLRFGSRETTVTEVTGNPAEGTLTPLNAGGTNVSMPLTVPSGGAFLTANPALVFGTGAVTVNYTGTGGTNHGRMDFTGTGSVSLPGVATSGTVAGVRWSRTGVVLNTDGASSQGFRVRFPAGLGYQSVNSTSGRMRGWADITPSLNPQLEPAGTAAVDRGNATLYVTFVHERLPLRIIVNRFTWDIAAGTFTPGGNVKAALTRAWAMQELRDAAAANPLENGDDGRRMSNDGYFGDEGTTVTVSGLVFSTSPEGRALVSCSIQNAQNGYQAHFPKGLAVPPGANAMTWQNSVISGGSVTQTSATATAVLTYSTLASGQTDCVNPGSPAASQTVQFLAAGGVWNFTADGGLRAAGAIQPADIPWGLKPDGGFTHTVKTVTGGVMATAGTGLAAAAYPGVSGGGAVYLPAAMLLSGHGSPANAALTERPGSRGYDPGNAATAAELAAAGLADYPGFNFRAANGSAPVLKAVSRIAAADLPAYDLKPHSKYYLRSGGVTGVHDAVTDQVSPLPRFYGYLMTLDGLRLSYLDGHNKESAISGSVELPAPAGFSLEFSRLKLTPAGELERVDLENPGMKNLRYWDVDIKPGAMEFASANACTVGGRKLVLAVSAVMPAISDDPLQARLGFEPDGNLVTGGQANGMPTDSRFALPVAMRLKGVNGGAYSFTPVTGAALNNPAASGAPPPLAGGGGGFVSFAGGLGVPFFDDLPVHILAAPSSRAGRDSLYHVAGGWTDTEGRTFFTHPDFDGQNRGFPPGVPFTAYRDNEREELLPVARRNWQRIVDLNYPLKWSAAGRFFTGESADSDEVLIVEVEHELQKLTSEGCAITFGAEFSTPQLSISTLAAEALSGGMSAVLPDAGEMLSGIDGLEKLLTDRFEKTISHSLESSMDPLAGQIVEELRAYYDNAGDAGFSGLTANALRSSSVFSDLKQRIAGLSQGADGLGARIQEALSGAMRACDMALNILEAGDGGYQVITGIAVALSRTDAGSTISGVSPAVLDGARDGLGQARQIILEVRQRLDDLSRDPAVTAQLGTILNAQADGAVAAVAERVAAAFRDAQDLTGRYMEEFTPAQHRARVMGILRQSLSGGALAAAVQPVLRGAFTEARSQFRGALDLVFAEINRLVNRTARQLVDDAVEKFHDLAGGTGAAGSAAAGVGDFCAAARMDGYAHIDGEEIEEIRINARLKFKLAASLRVDGWFRLLNVDSDTPNTTCRPPGVVAMEVTVGAAADADFGPVFRVAVSLEGKFSFGEENGQLKLAGLDGSFDLRAKMPVKQASLTHMAAKFGFGGGMGFISGQVEGTVYAFGANGRCFFGSTRNPADFNLLDPQTRRVLNLPVNTIPGTDVIQPEIECLNDPLTGFYTSLDLDISINQLFGIPDSCFLRVTGHVGVANFCFFKEDGSWLIPGVRYRFGVSGEVLCVLDLSAIAAIAVKVEIPVPGGLEEALSNPASFLSDLSDARATGYGEIEFKAGVGLGPFKIPVSKTLGMTMVLSKDDVDVSFN